VTCFFKSELITDLSNFGRPAASPIFTRVSAINKMLKSDFLNTKYDFLNTNFEKKSDFLNTKYKKMRF
jgi:hypothetical protein